MPPRGRGKTPPEIGGFGMVDDLALAPLTRTQTVAPSTGPVEGCCEPGLQVFKGLRYAAPPTGALRFKPPQRPAPWTGTADATGYGAPAIQSGLAPGERRVS